MPEVVSKATVLFGAYTCDKCGTVMDFDQKAYYSLLKGNRTNAPKWSKNCYPHICRNCGNKIVLNKYYPSIRLILSQELFRDPTSEEKEMLRELHE